MPGNSKEYMNKYMYGPGGYMKSRKKKDENAQRKRARYGEEKKGSVKPFDGKEVDHINGTKAGNGASNLRVISKTANRIAGAKKAIKARKSRLKY